MNSSINRRSILIGSATSAAFPLVASARGGVAPDAAAPGATRSAFLGEPAARRPGLSIPASRVAGVAITVEARGEEGRVRTAPGYVYAYQTADRTSRTAIVAGRGLLQGGPRPFAATGVALAFACRDGGGLPGTGGTVRLKVSARRIERLGDLAVVAVAHWRRRAGEWHLEIGSSDAVS